MKNKGLTINSDASVYLVGERRWLTGCGVCFEGYGKYFQLGMGTVNTGEFSGILIAAYIGLMKGRNTTVLSDSQFCCNLVNGNYSSEKFTTFMGVFAYLKEQYKRLGLTLTVKWIPREQNKEADALARQATALYKQQKQKTA